MTLNIFPINVIVEKLIEYIVQGVILSFALFIIPSFRSLNISLCSFTYIVIIIASMLIIIDRLLPDIARSIRSFVGLSIVTFSNPVLGNIESIESVENLNSVEIYD